MSETRAEWRCSRPDMESFRASDGKQVSYVYPPGNQERFEVATDNPVEDAAFIAAAFNARSGDNLAEQERLGTLDYLIMSLKAVIEGAPKYALPGEADPLNDSLPHNSHLDALPKDRGEAEGREVAGDYNEAITAACGVVSTILGGLREGEDPIPLKSALSCIAALRRAPPAEGPEVERVAALVYPDWFTPLVPKGDEMVHPLDNYPKQHEVFREQAREIARRIISAEPRHTASGDDLPTLPEPYIKFGERMGGGNASCNLYDREQMEQYARIALSSPSPERARSEAVMTAERDRLWVRALDRVRECLTTQQLQAISDAVVELSNRAREQTALGEVKDV